MKDRRWPGWAPIAPTRRGLLSGGVVALAGASGLLLARPPIRLGVAGDMSPGGAGDARGAVVAAAMAVEDFGGRVLGRDIKIFVGDTKADPVSAEALAQGWIERDGIAAVLGGGRFLQAAIVGRNRIFLETGAAPPALRGKACAGRTLHFVPDPAALMAAALAPSLDAGVATWSLVPGPSDPVLDAAAVTIIQSRGGAMVEHGQARGLAFASSGADLVDNLAQVRRTGMTAGRALVGLVVDVADPALSAPDASGLQFATSFYPAMSEHALAWSRRFAERHAGRMPGSVQAATFRATLHYLNALRAVGSDDTATVAAWLRAKPVPGGMMREVSVGQAGRVMDDLAVMRVRDTLDPMDRVERVATWPAGRSADVVPAVPC